MSFFDNGRGINSSGSQIYLSFGELYSWARAKKDDTTYGHCYTDMKAAFETIAEFFDGTIQVVDDLQPGEYYDLQQRLDYSTDPPSIRILQMPVICDEDDIRDIFWDKYNIWQVFYPWFYRPERLITEDEDHRAEQVCYGFCRRVNLFCKTNKLKYIRLLQLLNLEYNPIENYNMIEHGDEDINKKGKMTVEHKIADGYDPSYTKLVGPAASNATVSSPAFDHSKKRKAAVAQTGDTQNGMEGDTPSISGGVPSADAKSGTQNETEHYTTTYDDDSTGRLQSYDVNKGTIATTQKGVSEQDELVMLEQSKGNPNVYNYKDETSYDNHGDEKSHDLTRKGNIGVMTTQQMIEQERLIAEGFNLVNQFMEELSKELFLAVY